MIEGEARVVEVTTSTTVAAEVEVASGAEDNVAQGGLVITGIRVSFGRKSTSVKVRRSLEEHQQNGSRSENFDHMNSRRYCSGLMTS
jgi:hypothetical protein